MPVNRYDTPAQAQFINTYVPIPFQEMVAAGQMKQDRYDKASGAIDATIGALDEIMAIPNSADELRAKTYSDKMRQIRDKYVTRDLSDPFVQREMSNEIHSSVNKEDIKHIQQSYQGYANYNKLLAENAQRGVDTPNELLQNFTGYDSSDPTMGVFTGTPSMYKDPLKESEEFFNNLKSDRLGSFKEKIDGVETGRIGTLSGVTVDRILKHADENIESFVKLPAIKQMIEVARKRGDTREAEVIASEYVRAHAPEWAHTEDSNYAYDPFYKERASIGSDPSASPEPENIGLYPVKGETVNVRKMENEYKELTDKLNIGDPSALNRIKEIEHAWKAVENTPKGGIMTNPTPAQAIQKHIDTADAAFKVAFESLTELGMDQNAAFQYLYSNAQTNKAGVPTSIAAGIGRSKNSVDALKLLVQAGKNKDFTSAYKEFKKTFAEAKNSTKEQVLVSYLDKTKEIEKDLTKEKAELNKLKLEAYNKISPVQETYTKVNGMFKLDGSVLKGSYEDENGVSKKYASWVGKELTDALYNPDNYVKHFFDEKGKEVKKSEDIKKQIANSSGLTVTAIDNKPTDTGGVRVTLNMLNENDMPIGSKFVVEIPLRRKEDFGNFVRELSGRNQTETAFTTVTYPSVESKINSVDVYGGGEIKLSDVGAEGEPDDTKIVFETNSNSSLVTPILIKDGKKYKMSEPVGLKTLPSAITSYLYRNIL